LVYADLDPVAAEAQTASEFAIRVVDSNPIGQAAVNRSIVQRAFATELRRVAGVEAASQALGHSDLSTTLGIYGHQDQRDLERAIEAFADAREAEEAASRGNDSSSRLD
jgi:site-specific recombinase XerD